MTSLATPEAYEPGNLIIHPTRTGWGPGRVLATNGHKVTVYFRDLIGAQLQDAVKMIDTRIAPLPLADTQTDAVLDNLPPFKDGIFASTRVRRVTLEEGLTKFASRFPLYFEDPAYLGDAKKGERSYKWLAHQKVAESFGEGQLRQLLEAGDLQELRKRALAVESRVNLLPVVEKAAFKSGLQDNEAALLFFQTLADVLDNETIDEATFEPYLDAVDAFPTEGTKTSAAKWTIATILPFLAQPERFMFMKPLVSQQCAVRLGFDLKYTPELNWTTYHQLLVMSRMLMDRLRPFGARDLIDVQSFIWLIGRWESV